MPKVLPEIKMWFDLKDDPCKGRLEVRSLSSSEMADIEEQTVIYRRYFDLETMMEIPERRINRNLDRQLTFAAAVTDWENFQDQDGEQMECNEANKRKWASDPDVWEEFVVFWKIVQEKAEETRAAVKKT